MENKNKNPKNAGRKKLFLLDEVMNVIDDYILKNEPRDISASKVAKYANEVLGFNGMEYYHINGYMEAKDKIESLRRENRFQYITNDIQLYRNTDIDSLVNVLIKNPLKLKNYILDSRTIEKSMRDKIVILDNENKKIRQELKLFKDKDDAEKQDNKELKANNKELKDKMKTLQNLIDYENQITMCKYIWENKNISIEPNNLVDQYIKSLLFAGVITLQDAEEITSKNDVTSEKRNGMDEENEDDVVNIFADFAYKSENLIDEDLASENNNCSVDDLRDLLGMSNYEKK